MTKFKEELNQTYKNMVDKGIGFSGGFNTILARYRNKMLDNLMYNFNLLKNANTLEIGGADGLTSEFLIGRVGKLTILEPIKILAENLRRKFPGAIVHEVILEDLELYDTFDLIVAFNVLEHVENPNEFLKCIKNLMNKESMLVLTVPNKDSLHRKLGHKLGKITNLSDLTELDTIVGHKRYYDYFTLRDELNKVGLDAKWIEDTILKPFPNSIMKQIPEEYYEALHFISRDLSGLGAEIMALAVRVDRLWKYENFISD